MKELKQLIKQGISKKYLCTILDVSRPTLNKRLKDGKLKSYQIEKLKKLAKV